MREVQTWCPPGAMSVEEGTRSRSAVGHHRLCLIQLPQKVPEERVRLRVSLRCGEKVALEECLMKFFLV